MATLREVQKRMTHELLLDSGLEVLERKGYPATTIDDIATAAGTTRTTFYLHFSSKAELVSELLKRADEILTSVDDPSLTEVVRSGDARLIGTWLDSKLDQWDTIKPYLTVSYQASDEPDVARQTEQWYEDVVRQMTDGLTQAGRFEPVNRRIRCVLAFGQFEYLARRYFAVGWLTDRRICLAELTASWCHLLTE
ncbi:MAG TPA: TetR/AcrR family transcriptional regulator [Intrasporangium sp.]|uniref:TetR/AcrR family transcriptional regulator n=1 Tax=Intrasporangium sp. TaxID=1925024 RepID=UPI002B459E02|nr:TetR/AcrR family transcriptional regulator [Intrasporangium sp.]HKX66875.1 TetR/AcrR family transcriptional regulator [Intrasporangium sp.]